jgi:hypothetical protein
MGFGPAGESFPEEFRLRWAKVIPSGFGCAGERLPERLRPRRRTGKGAGGTQRRGGNTETHRVMRRELRPLDHRSRSGYPEILI